MPLFDAAIFDPAVFDTGAGSDSTLLSDLIVVVEKRKRNTLFTGYCWRHGIWEQTILREQVKQVEKRK